MTSLLVGLPSVSPVATLESGETVLLSSSSESVHTESVVSSSESVPSTSTSAVEPASMGEDEKTSAQLDRLTIGVSECAPNDFSAPHTTTNSPSRLSAAVLGDERSDSCASDRGRPIAISGQKHMPILSMPALPGQRVCVCMRAVEESATLQPTSIATHETDSADLHEKTAGGAHATPAIPLIPLHSPTNSAAASTDLASLDRILSLQDRFWLSVGEVALHNDDHGVERGVDSMETLAVKLAHIFQHLTHSISSLHSEQVRGVSGLMAELERKNSELVSYLQQTRLEEAAVRERIDQLSMQVEKAKKTVSMGGMLGLATSKQQREQSHLESVRALRDAAQQQLEVIVSNRNTAQNQMLNVSTIAAECRILDMDKRDYKLMYKQVQSSFFLRSFGHAFQAQVDTMVKALAKCREQSHECARRQALIEQTIHELRGRIALVVSAYWK